MAPFTFSFLSLYLQCHLHDVSDIHLWIFAKILLFMRLEQR